MAFLFLPTSYTARRACSSTTIAARTPGPSYDCPLIDSAWSMERIQMALTAAPAFAPTSPRFAYPEPDDDECVYCAHDLLDGDICPACGRLSP